MNSNSHAQNSAIIFNEALSYYDYLKIHEMIDRNKLVSASVFSRFFLHHHDVGGKILQAIFRDKKEIVSKVLTQHLIEDYGKVPTMLDWLESFDLKKIPMDFEKKKSLQEFEKELRRDEILQNAHNMDFVNIRNILKLSYFTDDPKIINHPAVNCVFGHALGIDLMYQIISIKNGNMFSGHKMSEEWTRDVLVHYVNKKFNFVPTLVNWENAVNQRDWMYAPKDYDRQDPKITIKRMDDFVKNPLSFKLYPDFKKNFESEAKEDWREFKRCNLD